jgi:hypothetical protein
MKKLIGLFLALMMISCSNKPIDKQLNFDSKKIDQAKYSIYFAQIDIFKNAYLVSHSNQVHGFQINSIDVKENSEKLMLSSSSKNTLQFVRRIDNCIYYVQSDFDQNSLRTKLFKIDLQTRERVELKLPAEFFIRKIISNNKYLVIEGNQFGSGKAFYSEKRANKLEWKNFNTLEKGYKSIGLNEISNNKIIAEASRAHNGKRKELVLMDLDINEVKTIKKLSQDEYYLKPITKHKNLHAIVSDEKIELFSIEKGEKSQTILVFKVPDNIAEYFHHFENLFVSDSFYVLSGRVNDKNSKETTNSASWISYDKGKNWMSFEHQNESRLVNNSFGKLFMTDNNNNIFEKTTGANIAQN